MYISFKIEKYLICKKLSTKNIYGTVINKYIVFFKKS